MRKLSFYLQSVLLMVMLYSCHRNHRPVVSIQTSDNNNVIAIKYNGTVSFSADSSAIEGLSPMSTLQYRNNDDYLQVTSNEQGQLTFEMTEEGNTLLMDARGKAFVAKAVKQMITQGVGNHH